MSGWRGYLVAGVLSVLAGSAAAWGTVGWLSGAEERAVGEPGDRVLEAVAGLRDDRVHVTDDGRAMLDREAEAEVAGLLAERDLPVHVVVWARTRSAGYEDASHAAEQILGELGEPAVVVVWEGPDSSTTRVTEGYLPLTYLPADAPGSAEGGRAVAPAPEYVGEAALRLPEWIAQLPDEPLQKLSDDL